MSAQAENWTVAVSPLTFRSWHLCTEANYAQLLYSKVQEPLFHLAASKVLAH